MKFPLLYLTYEMVFALKNTNRQAYGPGAVLSNMMLDTIYAHDPKKRDAFEVIPREFSSITVPDAAEVQGLNEIAGELNRINSDANLRAGIKDLRQHMRDFMNANGNRKAAKAFLKKKLLKTTIEIRYPKNLEFGGDRGQFFKAVWNQHAQQNYGALPNFSEDYSPMPDDPLFRGDHYDSTQSKLD